tara:strand:- start:287716 stop:287856 length:141 start_codon:yes stop_codon:yes gene_type:complete
MKISNLPKYFKKGLNGAIKTILSFIPIFITAKATFELSQYLIEFSI